jgi:predicted enzyme related to lactoylglutathione lyase
MRLERLRTESTSTAAGRRHAAETTGGNVTVFSDGNVGIGRGSSTTSNGDQPGDCCYFRLYTNGTDVAMANQGTLETNGGTDPGSAKRFQIYGTSDVHLDAKNVQTGGGGVVEATIYAPGASRRRRHHDGVGLISALSSRVRDDDIGVRLGTGSGEWRGAIVAVSVSFDQRVAFRYDDGLASVEPTVVGAGTVPPPNTVLQVTVHEVCVGDDDGNVDCADGDVRTLAVRPPPERDGRLRRDRRQRPGRWVDRELRVGLRRRDHSPSRTSASTSRFSERLVGVLGPRW